MSELCEHETFKDICGTCRRDAQITRLTAEVEKLRAALQWQPIETAPKDGTAIDLWSVGGFRYPSAAWDFIPPVNGWGWTDTNHHGSVEEYGPFSHWLPLPPPPAQEGDTEVLILPVRELLSEEIIRLERAKWV
jgi:hypothetical protein